MRIIEMAEREQAHRHAIEKHLADERVRDLQHGPAERQRGQWMAFGVSLAGLGAAAVLGAFGHGTAAGVVGGATLVALVAAFLTTRLTGSAR